MSDCDCEDECPECPAGIPAWVMTFADLMSLLMCFFVLLLAFSEMDALKYKQLAGSMSEAFGVQNEVKVKDIPKGTSIIAQEFSPGRPQPTPLNEVRQSTTDITRSTLDVNCPDGETESEEAKSDEEESAAEAAMEELQQMVLETQSDAMDVASALQDEIAAGQVEVETRGRKIVIRVKEHGSFASGSATLRLGFIDVMKKMRDVLVDIEGVYTVEGHTDDIPISTARFRSNWELSAARAVSVAHELFKDDAIDPRRFTIVGHADTRPLIPNEDYNSRARNRRVEIVVEQGGIEEIEEELPVFEPDEMDEVIDAMGEKKFDYRLDEIF